MMKAKSTEPAPSMATSTSNTPSRPIESRETTEQEDLEAGLAEPGAAVLLPDAARDGAHSYTCLYLRTKRIEKMLRISVITNSSIPTANTVLYWTLPVARSPLATDAM